MTNTTTNKMGTTKAKLARIRGHIEGGALLATYGRQGDEDIAKRNSLHRERPLELALLNLRSLIEVQETYAARDREFLAWLSTPAGRHVYPGASNAELAGRFEDSLKKHTKAAAGYRALSSELETHGLPPELQIADIARASEGR